VLPSGEIRYLIGQTRKASLDIKSTCYPKRCAFRTSVLGDIIPLTAYFDFLNKIEITLSLTISTATMDTTSSIKPPPEEWRRKKAEVWDKIERALSTLTTEGLFASLECFTYNKEREPLAPPGQEVQIECTLYFRGTDDEGYYVDAWKLDKSRDTMRDSSGNCTFCGTHVDVPHEDLELPAHLVRGSRDPGKTNARFR